MTELGSLARLERAVAEVIEAERNQIRGRIFLSKRRLYQLLVSGAKKNISDKDAEAFFSSFAWVK